MLPQPPNDFPYEPLLKKATTWTWAHTWARAIDSAIQWVIDNASPKPIIVENVESTGEFQTVNFPARLSAVPSLIRVVMREPPTVKAGMDYVCAAYRVEYGTHTAAAATVRVAHATAASKAKFDVWIWP
ncbi:hypothetical protein [Haliangium sp. UPWRP_2]|uniref:hypothetical protein n=1 Tax=Haliangium sp. UPWRP_2 TaxID=1931276 RepID=UPI001304950A|nr:hypothetical protein [Haliangium sp. UPWRP_2]